MSASSPDVFIRATLCCQQGACGRTREIILVRQGSEWVPGAGEVYDPRSSHNSQGWENWDHFWPTKGAPFLGIACPSCVAVAKRKDTEQEDAPAPDPKAENASLAERVRELESENKRLREAMDAVAENAKGDGDLVSSSMKELILHNETLKERDALKKALADETERCIEAAKKEIQSPLGFSAEYLRERIEKALRSKPVGESFHTSGPQSDGCDCDICSKPGESHICGTPNSCCDMDCVEKSAKANTPKPGEGKEG